MKAVSNRAATKPFRRLRLLGASCRFESDHRGLLRLVDAAYEGVPSHRLQVAAPELCIELVMHATGKSRWGREPPTAPMFGGNGLLGSVTAESNCVILSPQTHSALVMISPRMIRFPYHLRYEYIEFAVFALAARVQQLVPLHAACVGTKGGGVLLMGDSGAGKSTVALQCLLRGMEFVAEDAVFVAADTLQATGIANYLHVGEDSLRWLEHSRDRAMVRRSPTIRRRSGARKYELNLRRRGYRLARSPLKIQAVVFLTTEPAGAQPLLRPLRRQEFLARLKTHQEYGIRQAGWNAFERKVTQVAGFEMRRGSHPAEAAAALRALLSELSCALR